MSPEALVSILELVLANFFRVTLLRVGSVRGLMLTTHVVTLAKFSLVVGRNVTTWLSFCVFLLVLGLELVIVRCLYTKFPD